MCILILAMMIQIAREDGLLLHDSFEVADLTDLEQYKPLPGFAPLGGKATFQWKDGKLTTARI